MTNVPMEDMGRGILAPPDNRNIETGAKELRTLAATAAAAFSDVEDSILTTIDEKGYVQGVQVKTIRVSATPYAIPADGELVLISETPKYFTYFQETPVGEAPIDMTDMWETDYTRQVVSDDTVMGGKLLRLASAKAEYRLLAVPVPNELEEPTACEIAIKWRADVEAAIPRLVVYGSGEPGSEYGIHSMYVRGQARSGRFRNGYPATHDGRSWTFTPNQWYVTRARIQVYQASNQLEFRHKMTAAHLPEVIESAGQWAHRQTEDLNNIPSPGVPGIYFRGPGEAFVDWVSVSWDLGAAPKPDVK